MEHIQEANERITPLVTTFMNNKPSWEGPASRLHELLSVETEGGMVPPANHLSRKLLEHKDKLFCLGVDVELRRTARGRLVSLKRTNMGVTDVTVMDNRLKAQENDSSDSKDKITVLDKSLEPLAPDSNAPEPLANDSKGDVAVMGMTADFIRVVCVKCTEFEQPGRCHYADNLCSPSRCFMPVVRSGRLWEGK